MRLCRKDLDQILSLISLVLKRFLKYIKLTERKLKYHDETKEREVWFDTLPKKKDEPSKIILVNDCINTGYTIDAVLNYVSSNFINSEIMVAVLSCFDERNNNEPDHYLYKNTVLSASWTKDNRAYHSFFKHYKNRKK